MANDLIRCALCGQGSHRDDWQGKVEVFCDSHSQADIAAFKASKTPAPGPVAVPAAAQGGLKATAKT
jgi:hypothetical protein